MADLRRLEDKLGASLKWNRARIKFLVRCMVALVQVRTVNLSEIAGVFAGAAQLESNYKRVQRFLRWFEVPYGSVAVCVVSLVGVTRPWVLTMDRTNWKFGKTWINILVLGIVHRGVAIPVFWQVLPKRGNSNTTERKALVSRFTKEFGLPAIRFLCADREFIGERWVRWLRRSKIDFRIRVRNNTRLTNRNGQTVAARTLFRQLPIQQELILPNSVTVWKQRLAVSGMRLADGDYLIVITPQHCPTAIRDYALRWEIETLFGCLKSRGFNLEETHLTDPKRIEKLFAVLTLAFCWAICVGEWLVSFKPLKIKKHGRLARSVFRSGLDHLRRILCSLEGKSQQIAFKEVAQLLSCT